MHELFLNKINRRAILLLLLFSALFQYACKKEGGGGTPMITSVRLLDSTKRDSTFTQALPGVFVVVQGQGFTGLQEVYINDTLIPFNIAIQSDNKIVLKIPESVPTEATNPTVSNQIKVVTSHGEATFAFTLVAPPPSITAISNEMALPGQVITITGANFYNVQKVIFPGNIEVTNQTVNSPTQITVTVPSNLTATGPIKIVSKYGTGGNDLINFGNEKQAGMLATFDNEGTYSFGWGYWGGIKAADATAFPGGRGTYIQINPTGGVNANDGSWYTNNRAVNVNHDTLDANSPLKASTYGADPIGNYALKFEMFQKTAWKNGSLVMRIGNPYTYSARFTPWKTAPGGEYKTDGWVTVTIPLSEFKTKSSSGVDAAGDPAPNFSTLFAAEAASNPKGGDFGIMLINDSSTPIPQYNAAFDNIRIVKVR